MNSDQVFVVSMTFLICTSAVVLFVALAAIRRRKSPPVTPSADPALTDRLERMERAIDTIAVEIERVSEAQRFVTKVLAERKAPPAVPERVITPH